MNLLNLKTCPLHEILLHAQQSTYIEQTHHVQYYKNGNYNNIVIYSDYCKITLNGRMVDENLCGDGKIDSAD